MNLLTFLLIFSAICLILKGKRGTFSIGFDWTGTLPKVWFAKGRDWSCIWNGKNAHDTMLKKRLIATGYYKELE